MSANPGADAMPLYDKLPSVWREALANSPYNWQPQATLQLQARGHTVEAVARIISKVQPDHVAMAYGAQHPQAAGCTPQAAAAYKPIDAQALRDAFMRGTRSRASRVR